MTTWHTQDSTSLLAAIQNRQISSVELLTLFRERMEQYNEAINAVVTVDMEGAMARANAADEALARGERWGILHGLPMTIKDTYEVAGMRTTAGTRTLRDYYPTSNAAVVQKLLDEGAIIFGKSNTPSYAMDVQTYNKVFGVTNNPWNLAHTSGGSSGGAAAAVAAGFSTLEVGSDIGGSIRTPANFCGVYGHKPTHGIISLHGHIPGPPGTKSHPDLSVAGPIARSPQDLALALSVLAGPEPLQAVGWTLDLPKPRHDQISDFRVAVWFDDERCPVDPELVKMFEETVKALQQAGVTVTEAKPAEMKEILRTYYTLLASITGSSLSKEQYEQVAKMKENLAEVQQRYQLPDDFMTHIAGRTASHRQWLGANEQRAKLQYRCRDFFKQYDILITPITPMAAPLHNHSARMEARKLIINGQTRPYVDHFPWIALATMAGLPATAAPIGFTQANLPVNAQLIGPYLEDYTTIKFAELLADVHGGLVLPGEGLMAH